MSRKNESSAFVSQSGQGYDRVPSAFWGKSRRKRELSIMGQFCSDWSVESAHDRQAATLVDTIRAIHDVMQMAAHPGASLRVMCTTMTKLVRDDWWQEATGTTYGEQLEQIAEANGKVDIVVAADLEYDRPFSPSVRRAIGQYGVGPLSPLQLVYSGEDAAEYWKTFPHFTIASRGGDRWYAAVEWDVRPCDYASMTLSDKFVCDVYGEATTARMHCEGLIPKFDEIVERFKEASANRVTLV